MRVVFEVQLGLIGLRVGGVDVGFAHGEPFRAAPAICCGLIVAGLLRLV